MSAVKIHGHQPISRWPTTNLSVPGRLNGFYLQADHVSNKSQKAYFFSFNEIGLPGRAYLDYFQGGYVASFKCISPSLETSWFLVLHRRTDRQNRNIDTHTQTNRCRYALMDPFKGSPSSIMGIPHANTQEDVMALQRHLSLREFSHSHISFKRI